MILYHGTYILFDSIDLDKLQDDTINLTENSPAYIYELLKQEL